ncbi:hypothetical protein JCM33374_g5178 [Metschnikowia sp. JCM 33374]|nr:hypothetical protein JCM33374_g5178 [Metschnikowia sp. JCM 33374]
MMSGGRTKKTTKVRGPAVVPESDSLRARKEENFQLHDEADLVNFRADALTRYITNQDLLDNVSSKLFHTSRIIPPALFPQQDNVKKLYEENATDDELIAVLRDMKVGDLYSGDIRLMRAKAKQSAQELEQLSEELSGLADTSVLDEQAQFQKAAVEKLAIAQSQCTDAETLLELEKLLELTVQEYKDRFSREYTFSCDFQKHSVPIQELAPGTEVKQAPADYNPRSISSFINIKNNSPMNQDHKDGTESIIATSGIDTAASGTALEGSTESTVPISINNNMQIDSSRYTGPGDEYMGGEEYDEFGILVGGEGRAAEDNVHESIPYEPQMNSVPDIQTGEGGSFSKPHHESGQDSLVPVSEQDGGATEALGPMANDVDMDEIDQFLADPDGGDGMDGMDALMDFDHANEHEEVMGFNQGNEHDGSHMDEDQFNVDFLSHIGNDME